MGLLGMLVFSQLTPAYLVSKLDKIVLIYQLVGMWRECCSVELSWALVTRPGLGFEGDG